MTRLVFLLILLPLTSAHAASNPTPPALIATSSPCIKYASDVYDNGLPVPPTTTGVQAQQRTYYNKCAYPIHVSICYQSPSSYSVAVGGQLGKKFECQSTISTLPNQTFDPNSKPTAPNTVIMSAKVVMPPSKQYYRVCSIGAPAGSPVLPCNSGTLQNMINLTKCMCSQTWPRNIPVTPPVPCNNSDMNCKIDKLPACTQGNCVQRCAWADLSCITSNGATQL